MTRTTYTISSTGIDAYIWDVIFALAPDNGMDNAARMASPLTYYINTGRASTDFLRRLFQIKPARVARIIAKGGSDNDIMAAIKRVAA